MCTCAYMNDVKQFLSTPQPDSCYSRIYNVLHCQEHSNFCLSHLQAICNAFYVLLPYSLSIASPNLSMTSPATIERLWTANDSSAATLAMWQPPQAASMRGGRPPGNFEESCTRSWYVRIHARCVAIAPVITSPCSATGMFHNA